MDENLLKSIQSTPAELPSQLAKFIIADILLSERKKLSRKVVAPCYWLVKRETRSTTNLMIYWEDGWENNYSVVTNHPSKLYKINHTFGVHNSYSDAMNFLTYLNAEDDKKSQEVVFKQEVNTKLDELLKTSEEVLQFNKKHDTTLKRGKAIARAGAPSSDQPLKKTREISDQIVTLKNAELNGLIPLESPEMLKVLEKKISEDPSLKSILIKEFNEQTTGRSGQIQVDLLMNCLGKKSVLGNLSWIEEKKELTSKNNWNLSYYSTIAECLLSVGSGFENKEDLPTRFAKNFENVRRKLKAKEQDKVLPKGVDSSITHGEENKETEQESISHQKEDGSESTSEQRKDKVIDLSSLLIKSQCKCLNESDDHNLEHGLTAEGSGYLESDCDEKLIISLTFRQAVEIHSLKIKAPADKGPKNLKLFINQPRTIDFNMADSNTSVQDLTLTLKDLEEETPVALRSDKFQNVLNLQMFIRDNQGGCETTQIDHFTFYGSPMVTTNMGDCKRVAGKKKKSH